MRIGMIGAGKVGFSLGKYFRENAKEVVGYFSQNPASAKEAADFTDTCFYQSVEDLVRDSDVLFLTVPDGQIEIVWQQIKKLSLANKVICHCSGVLSSQIFLDASKQDFFAYSIHPLLAVSSKYDSYRELKNALFTIEGSDEKLSEMKALMESCGNQVRILSPTQKPRYHAAAVLASNLVLGLFETAKEELMQCGFTGEEAGSALAPFLYANAKHLLQMPASEALTGPVERGDVTTVKKHLSILKNDDLEIYRLLSRKALVLAKEKNPERDYKELEELING